MACLDIMLNSSEHQNGRMAPNTSPRISFSNDFVDTNQMISHEKRTPTSSTSSRSDQVSSDFEFSVTNYNMMAADELFSKGRLLPYKPNCSSTQFQPKMTLREELLHDEEGDRTMSSSSRPPKGPSRWKELLGLKRSHIVSKKADKKSMFGVHEEEARASSKSSHSQEALTDEDIGM